MNERTYHQFERDQQETPSEVVIFAQNAIYNYRYGNLDDANATLHELEQFFGVQISPKVSDNSLPD
jgi:hypothetical protein